MLIGLGIFLARAKIRVEPHGPAEGKSSLRAHSSLKLHQSLNDLSASSELRLEELRRSSRGVLSPEGAEGHNFYALFYDLPTRL